MSLEWVCCSFSIPDGTRRIVSIRSLHINEEPVGWIMEIVVPRAVQWQSKEYRRDLISAISVFHLACISSGWWISEILLAVTFRDRILGSDRFFHARKPLSSLKRHRNWCPFSPSCPASAFSRSALFFRYHKSVYGSTVEITIWYHHLDERIWEVKYKFKKRKEEITQATISGVSGGCQTRRRPVTRTFSQVIGENDTGW